MPQFLVCPVRIMKLPLSLCPAGGSFCWKCRIQVDTEGLAIEILSNLRMSFIHFGHLEMFLHKS